MLDHPSPRSPASHDRDVRQLAGNAPVDLNRPFVETSADGAARSPLEEAELRLERRFPRFATGSDDVGHDISRYQWAMGRNTNPSPTRSGGGSDIN
jgi:hypothetical protein